MRKYSTAELVGLKNLLQTLHCAKLKYVVIRPFDVSEFIIQQNMIINYVGKP